MGIGRIALLAKPGVLHVDVRQIVAALAAMAMRQLRMQNTVLVRQASVQLTWLRKRTLGY